MIYTCPMHPEIRQEGPGACPICGMSLEPVLPTEEHNPELRYMTTRFVVALILTLLMPFAKNQLLLATPVVLWCAFPFFVRGIKSLNMFTLISIGVGASYLYSLFKAPIYLDAATWITTL
ncbi:MAG: haloacid dehalogenase, partial [Verrucomicrobia bacterium]|nr:haloacid dehalogenase [Verrucomicrobiota bacterium]